MAVIGASSIRAERGPDAAGPWPTRPVRVAASVLPNRAFGFAADATFNGPELDAR
jgi:hypothetical protein